MEIPRKTDFTIYMDQEFNIDRVIIDSKLDYSWKFYIIHAKYLKTSRVDGKGYLDYYKYHVYKDAKETTLKIPHLNCEIWTVESYIGKQEHFRSLHYPIQIYNKYVFRFLKSSYQHPITKSFYVNLIEKYNKYHIKIIGDIFTLIDLLKKIGNDSFEFFLVKENILYLKEFLMELEKEEDVGLDDYIELIACLFCQVIKPIKQKEINFSNIQEQRKIESDVEKIENQVRKLFLKVSSEKGGLLRF